MSQDAIANLLRQRVGFDAKIIGDRKIARAIEHRRAVCHATNTDTYLKTLESSSQEFNQLVEQIVVPETWFFRDRKSFDFLISFVRSEWLLKSGTTKLRVLSVPCSTGEEPYSIAIALLEAGLSTKRFSVDAIDISQHALAKAQQATYGKNSFRGGDWVERSRYFQPVEDKYAVRSFVRDVIQFRQGNALNELGFTQSKYDIIFCRNLLIYLEDSACQQVLSSLHNLLSAQGLLFVGASETAKVPGDRFSYLRQSFTFTYRKTDAVLPQSVSLDPSDAKLERTTIKAVTSQIPPQFKQSSTHSGLTQINYSSIKTSQSQTVTAASTDPSSKLDLQQARQLADAGHLKAGIDYCKTYLEHNPTDVEAYALLGTLYQAIADSKQAERCFQKALYLHPHHYETLVHFALLKEARGDAIGAKRLQQRLQKQHAKSSTHQNR
jgi:chemotaxis protein methyltransferase WspC